LQVNDKYLIALVNRGASRMDAGNISAAKTDFDEVIKKDPSNSSAFNGLASVFIKQKEYKKAKDMADKAIQLNPKNGPAYYNRGIARQMLREEEGSCADWKKAVELGVTAAKSFINSDCTE
ncbi:MAG: tetratricopeptide repeat protein, partial [Bacteroidia bacterium]|nr:tetratricopeptide repeat protein [Bacteroidia bacterium]